MTRFRLDENKIHEYHNGWTDKTIKRREMASMKANRKSCYILWHVPRTLQLDTSKTIVVNTENEEAPPTAGHYGWLV